MYNTHDEDYDEMEIEVKEIEKEDMEIEDFINEEQRREEKEEKESEKRAILREKEKKLKKNDKGVIPDLDIPVEF